MAYESTASDPVVILLHPFTSYNDMHTTLPGVQILRASCGHLSWISPAALEFLADHPDASSACLNCPPDKITACYSIPGAFDAVRRNSTDPNLEPFKIKVNGQDLAEYPH